MDVISKKCYYGTILETLDPLSISTIDATLFEVYSKIPGEIIVLMKSDCDKKHFKLPLNKFFHPQILSKIINFYQTRTTSTCIQKMGP